MKNKLAIVIPAYKSTFLSAALDSIASQTCKDFTLYIGDDCSPNNIGEIVDRYRDKINLVYKRFDSNLGGRDLVAQWERCIDMTQDEPWLWLFSDDDVMERNCVEEFYKEVNEKSMYYHFDVRKIDTAGKVIRELPKYPKRISAKEFLDMKTDGRLSSFVVEFIFNKDFFLSAGRFVNFDLAWGSDYITILKLAGKNDGIVTIPKAKVNWRASDENISPNKSPEILKRKMMSVVDNLKWIKMFVTEQLDMSYSRRYYKYFFGEMLRQKQFISEKDGIEIINYFGRTMNLSFYASLFKIYWKLI